MNILPRILLRVALLALSVAWVAHVSVVVWGPGAAPRVGEAVAEQMHLPEVEGVSPQELNAPAAAAVSSLWAQLGESERPKNVIEWVLDAAEAAGHANGDAAATGVAPAPGTAGVEVIEPSQALSSVERVAALSAFMRPVEKLFLPALALWFAAAFLALLSASGSRASVLRNHGFWAAGVGVATLLVGFALRYASERFDWFVLTGAALRAAWLPLYAQSGVLIGFGLCLMFASGAAQLLVAKRA
jgi:hypothetical protein